MAHIAGLVAAGLHPSPVPYAEIVTTTTHKTLRGPRGGMILCREQFAKALNSQIFPGIQGGPLMHVIAAKAVAFGEALQPRVQGVPAADRREREGARRGARSAPGCGCLGRHRQPPDAGGPAPEEAHRQGRPRRCSGKAGITVNKNMIPFDPEKPMVTSGVRVGTPALTTRGMKEAEMARWASSSARRSTAPGDEAALRAGARAGEGALRSSSRSTPRRLKLERTLPCAVPSASDPENKVIDSRESQEGAVIRRRRECLGCKRRFTTYERVEELLPLIVKKDGRREAVRPRQAGRGAEEGLREAAGLGGADGGARVRGRAALQEMGEKEVPSSVIGEEVMRRLQRARPGGLRALRLGVPSFRGHRRVHERAEGAIDDARQPKRGG